MEDWPLSAHNVFFAAVTPGEVAVDLLGAWRQVGTSDRFRRPTLHATILGIESGDVVRPEIIRAAQRSADELSLPSFDLMFDRVMTFKPRGKVRDQGECTKFPIVLGMKDGSDSMNLVGEMLRKALALRGIATEKRRRITPHVTLAYGRGFSETRFLPKPIYWQIRQISLIDSLQGKGRHIRLGNWPLTTLH